MNNYFINGMCALLSSCMALGIACGAPNIPMTKTDPPVAQSSVAQSKPFESATPVDAAKAIMATDTAKAGAQEGKVGAVQGVVANVFIPSGNKVVILDFAKDYDAAVSAVIFARDYRKFPNLLQLNGKHILVSGKFDEYRGRPEIIVSAARGIKLLP